MRMPGPRTWWTGARCREGRSMTQQGPKAPQMFGRGYLPAGATPPTPEEVEKERVQREVATLRAELATAKEQVARVRALKSMVGTVIELEGSQAYVSIGKSQYSLLDVTAWPELKPGSVLQIGMTKEGALAATRQIIHPSQSGTIVTVDKVHGSMFEFCGEGGVAHGARVGVDALEPGDRVLLDPNNEIAIKHLGRKKSRALTRVEPVEWDDIGGLENVKLELQEAVEDPIKYRELYRLFGQVPPRGILLAGPPGTGKTLLARACATALAKIHGKSALESGFIPCAGPEILNMFVGNSEAAIRLLFESARRHEKEHGYPAVIFFDEIDSLAQKRGASRLEGVEKTVVPQLLAEMDGLEASNVLVLMATNRPGLLDPALLRDGRLDRKVFVDRPDRRTCEAIFRVHLKKRPCEVEKLVPRATELLFLLGKHTLLRRVVVRDADSRAPSVTKELHLADVVNGAMVEGIVKRAGQLALREAKTGKGRVITEAHIEEAVARKAREERIDDHEDAIRKLVGEANVRMIERVETPAEE